VLNHQKNPDCDPYKDIKFDCLTVGVFPDPGDCRVYHVCARKMPEDEGEVFTYTKVICEGPQNEYGFNPKTGLCDKKLTNRRCDTYPILCPGAGSFALTANSVFYYECLKHQNSPGDWRYPFQKRCLNGKKYTGNDCK